MEDERIGKKVLLYSGGMDSWLISKLIKCDCLLYVDIGTPGSLRELEMVQKENEKCPGKIIVEKLDLSRFEVPGSFMLPLRNLYLCMLAMNYGTEIILGSVKTDKNIDNTLEFVSLASAMLTFLSPQVYGKTVRINVSNPCRSLTKGDLLRKYHEQGGDLGEAWDSTMSCYSPLNGRECGDCLSCRLKRDAFADLGWEMFR